MNQTNKGNGSKLRLAVLCGMISLGIVFVLLPHVFTLITRFVFPIPDLVWMSIMILTPVAIAIDMLGRKAHIPAKYVWVGLPTQYLILIVFSSVMRKISPLASDSWTYIWEAAVWPLSVTTAQFVSLVIWRRWKVKRRQ